MRQIRIETEINFSILPAIYSFINSICAIVLIIAYIYIRNKKIEQHKKSMTVAMFLSLIFLVLYVIYHVTTAETKFCGEGNIRIFYFILLISHIVLAAICLPLVMLTYIRGYLMKVEQHRSMAKWVFPIWLFVCISGPICYLLLRPCYI